MTIKKTDDFVVRGSFIVEIEVSSELTEEDIERHLIVISNNPEIHIKDKQTQLKIKKK